VVPVETEEGVPGLHAVTRSQGRVKTSISVDGYLWQLFKKRCEVLGISTCHVLEGLIKAWITGEVTQISEARPMVINFKMEHVVQRPRRSGSTVQVSVLGSPEKCRCCIQRSSYLEYYTVSPELQVTMYVCRRHHEEHRRAHILGGWREI